jgi:hypothetical protein
MNAQLYNKLKKLTLKMCSDRDTCIDLFHDILLQCETNPTFTGLTEDQQRYYFVGIVRRQVYSTNSSYYRMHKKYNFTELKDTDDMVDVDYVETPDMTWVKKVLNDELEKNPDFWYNKQLFELYLDKGGVIEKVYQQTRIPRYSIKDTINEMKKWLKQKWQELN